jgi:glutamate synthase domain-containing protein 3
VMRILIHLAEDARRHLASLGLTRFEELRDRTDFLRVAPAHEQFVRERKLDLSSFLTSPAPSAPPVPLHAAEGVGPLNQRILEDAAQVLSAKGTLHLAYDITTGDRGVLATLSGAIARRIHERRMMSLGSGSEPIFEGRLQLDFQGSAGQGFGAFLVEGLDVRLRGEANDSVCKSMSGGTVVIRPHPSSTFPAEENAIIGNGALYGATGGTLYICGLAGDRFAVRNSGAVAVVEGTGHHACEYMTRGNVAILGKVHANVGAGMTGGTLFLRRDQDAQVNPGYLRAAPWTTPQESEFHQLLTAYAKATESRTAQSLLADWPGALEAFAPYTPLALAH